MTKRIPKAFIDKAKSHDSGRSPLMFTEVSEACLLLINADLDICDLEGQILDLKRQLQSEVDGIALQMMAGANANPGSADVSVEDIVNQGYLLAEAHLLERGRRRERDTRYVGSCEP